MNYHHTQVGTMTIASIAVMVVLLTAQSIALRMIHPAIVVVGLLVVAVLLLFSSLTVEVKEGAVFLRFGPGLIHREIRLAEIADAKPVRNSWMAGWGIRWIPGQYVMWNVAGLQAVELTMKDGKRFRIGTDEPQELANAIQNGRMMTA